ncbi:hypothetical protein MNB_SV-5-857 [hydrothermal vent metagenome]|uniref:Uncharacterized protein n=1 Tax=hydrothermal vent metagenome TaxID=652676 RepID=A0A1W1ECE8_9ZZZZ
MERCDQISANVKMEECYAGLSLSFSRDEELRNEIETAINKIQKKTKMSPLIFDNSKDHTESKQSLYIEFTDEVQRDSGEFFELLLKELCIEKCANEVIAYKRKGKC